MKGRAVVIEKPVFAERHPLPCRVEGDLSSPSSVPQPVVLVFREGRCCAQTPRVRVSHSPDQLKRSPAATTQSATIGSLENGQRYKSQLRPHSLSLTDSLFELLCPSQQCFYLPSKFYFLTCLVQTDLSGRPLVLDRCYCHNRGC